MKMLEIMNESIGYTNEIERRNSEQRRESISNKDSISFTAALPKVLSGHNNLDFFPMETINFE
jgi:hypothetical protein